MTGTPFPYPMLEESEARQRILSLIPNVTAESVRLDQALGRYAAVEVFATLPLPPFDNSAMDGYAIHQSDCGAAGRKLLLGVQLGVRRARRVDHEAAHVTDVCDMTVQFQCLYKLLTGLATALDIETKATRLIAADL